MTRAITETEIANQVARTLKASTTSGINPPQTGSKLSNAVAAFFDDARRECLRDHTWNFAETEASLPAAATAPVAGKYGTRYLLPDDYIRITWVYDEENPIKDFRIKNGFIYCNEAAPLPIGYIFDQEDITKFDAKFLNAFVLLLSSKVAYDLTGNANFRDAILNDYRAALSSAATVDGQESPPVKRNRRSKWKQAKEGSGYYGRDAGRYSRVVT